MISIIIPSHNRAHFLPRALLSIINQEYNSWEAIVVDDGSSDNTEEVVGRLIEKDSRIKYIRKANSGATHSRNIGVEKAKGDYITFLDSDDEAEPNWLKSFNELIVTKGARVICCGYEYRDHNNEFIKQHFPKPMGSLYNNKIGRFTNGGVYILEKDLFLKAGGFDENVKAGQHSEMAIRLFQILEQKDIIIYNLNVSLIKVHVHKGEKIRNNDLALYEGTKYVLEKHKLLFCKNKRIYSNNLGIAAVSAVRLGKYKEAKGFFYHSWILSPLNVKKFIRWLISLIPFLAQRFWKRDH